MRRGAGDTSTGQKVPWGDVVLAAVAAVSWALIGMAGAAALGLRLLDADATAALGPMTAAVVVLGAGGSVTPSGDVSAYGLRGAEATTAIEVTPLGVSLAGALLLGWLFLRSLRAAGVVVSGAELAARVGAVVVLFLGMIAGLAWAGHDIITIDGDTLTDGVVDGVVPDGGALPDGIADRLPDGLGDIGGLLPDRIGELIEAEAAVGFTVDMARSLVGGAVWVLGVLLIALLASRRTPLPRWGEAVHRVLRPAASALVAVLLMAVVAGLAAAAYAMIGDDHPRRVAGAALLGAPNGVWLGVPLGLFVPWDGHASGSLVHVLPSPLDELLSSSSQDPVTLARLAELDGRVWLLAVAAALLMLLAGVLTAVRTPLGGQGAAGFAGRCAVRLGGVTALGLPLLVWLTRVSADASLSVLGVDAFGAALELRGQVWAALLLGAAWGAGAGGTGALLAYGAGAAGGRVVPLAGGSPERGAAVPSPTASPEAGPYNPAPPYRPADDETNPYLRPPSGGDGGRGPYPRPPDVSSAPTVAGPVTPPPRPARGRGGKAWPVPPPPPPPPPPEEGPPPRRGPGGRR